MFGSFLLALDFLGTAVFAVTGALVASRRQMDVVGFMLLAAVTGIGGGSARDVLLGTLPVFWVEAPVYLGICIAVAVVTFFVAHIPESRYRALLWLDAAGLAVFCVVGAEKALLAGAGPYIAVAMGVITATLGGVIRDVLGGEIPLILRKEVYVTAALAGAAAFVAMIEIGFDGAAAMIAGFAVCFLVRAFALHYRWSLPVYRARAGGTVE